MAEYVVQKGDTLGGIAKKLGLSSYNDLTGYKSGNPNLIYAGEKLTYGNANPQAADPSLSSMSQPDSTASTQSGSLSDLYKSIFNAKSNVFDLENYNKMVDDHFDSAEKELVSENDTLGKALIEQARERLNSVGALGDGASAAYLEDLRGKNDQQKSKILADLALSRMNAKQSGYEQYTDSVKNDFSNKQSLLSFIKQVPYGTRINTPWGEVTGINQSNENTQIVNANGRQLLINQATGDIIRDLGSSASASRSGGSSSSGNSLSVGSRSQDQSGGIQFTNSKGQAITPSEFARLNRITLAQALEGSQNQGDLQFLQDFNDAQNAVAQGLINKTQAIARLKQAYPWMGNITL